ncbi:MAG: TonB-dependent receptor plug domain-containing protein [Flavobacteriaceae bacterium]|nr:TonB-dependent receptor plug domain-containing protein [Flavobacteriaceae bacterium]
MSILLSTWLIAQQTNGVVTDSNGIPLAFVEVFEENTTHGTLSTDDGSFTINTSSLPVRLHFKALGFASQSIMIDQDSTNLSIVMQESELSFNEVVLVGSRNRNRTVVDTPVPIDVIDVQSLSNNSPQTSVNEILNYVAPSFTSQPQTVSDGTDHIDPASLRGLGPDQILVLINGKRRHTSALINVNGTVGAGSVGTDLNSIPTAAIQRIEVLRDGAAAQYGSDAIAGVINIVLKKDTGSLALNYTTGAHLSANANQFEGGIDGQRFKLDANYGLALGSKGGYINFTGELSSRTPALRNKDYSGDIFRAYHGAERLFAASGGSVATMNLQDYQNAAAGLTYLSPESQETIAGLNVDLDSDIETLRGLLDVDADEGELAARGLTRKDFRFKVGTSELNEGKFFEYCIDL